MTSAAPGSVQPASVSPRMAELVANAIRLNSIYTLPDTDAADAADGAIAALVNHTPTSLTDLAAKLLAIAEVVPVNDCDAYVLNRLAEDATILVGEAR
jgi:hypothetical protein